VTSDKCYENREQQSGYRENDALGGHDPYSASKGATELVVASYRRSYGHLDGACRLASARAGNVIGGGDWSADRIVVDFIQAIASGRSLELRSPWAIRPWQHVLEPVSGYLHLAAQLFSQAGSEFVEAWNFGPAEQGMVTVDQLARALVDAWGSGVVKHAATVNQLHEAGLLTLDCRKASERLGWKGVWSVGEAVLATTEWYRMALMGENMCLFTKQQISAYSQSARAAKLAWVKEGP
jgi:CDP-glucose 4,6-dehydratase